MTFTDIFFKTVPTFDRVKIYKMGKFNKAKDEEAQAINDAVGLSIEQSKTFLPKMHAYIVSSTSNNNYMIFRDEDDHARLVRIPRKGVEPSGYAAVFYVALDDNTYHDIPNDTPNYNDVKDDIQSIIIDV